MLAGATFVALAFTKQDTPAMEVAPTPALSPSMTPYCPPLDTPANRGVLFTVQVWAFGFFVVSNVMVQGLKSSGISKQDKWDIIKRRYFLTLVAYSFTTTAGPALLMAALAILSKMNYGDIGCSTTTKHSFSAVICSGALCLILGLVTLLSYSFEDKASLNHTAPEVDRAEVSRSMCCSRCCFGHVEVHNPHEFSVPENPPSSTEKAAV